MTSIPGIAVPGGTVMPIPGMAVPGGTVTSIPGMAVPGGAVTSIPGMAVLGSNMQLSITVSLLCFCSAGLGREYALLLASRGAKVVGESTCCAGGLCHMQH